MPGLLTMRTAIPYAQIRHALDACVGALEFTAKSFRCVPQHPAPNPATSESTATSANYGWRLAPPSPNLRIRSESENWRAMN